MFEAPDHDYAEANRIETTAKTDGREITSVNDLTDAEMRQIHQLMHSDLGIELEAAIAAVTNATRVYIEAEIERFVLLEIPGPFDPQALRRQKEEAARAAEIWREEAGL